MKNFICVLMFLCFSFCLFAQNNANDKDIDQLNTEIKSLKAANAKLKTMLSESLKNQDKKLDDFNGNLKSAECKVASQTDSLKQVYLSNDVLKKYAYHKIARHRKIIKYGFIWAGIAFLCIICFIVLLFFILRARTVENFQYINEKLLEAKDLFNKQINLTNESFTNKINDINSSVDQQLESLKVSLNNNIEKLLKNINGLESGQQLIKNEMLKLISETKQNIEDSVNTLNGLIDKKLTASNQTVDSKVLELKKEIETKKNELQNLLNSHIHKPA